MTKILITTTALFALAAPVFADVADVDVDGDGYASMSELLTLYPTVTEEAFFASDVNGDGLLDDAELTAAEDAGLLVAG